MSQYNKYKLRGSSNGSNSSKSSNGSNGSNGSSGSNSSGSTNLNKKSNSELFNKSLTQKTAKPEESAKKKTIFHDELVKKNGVKEKEDFYDQKIDQEDEADTIRISDIQVEFSSMLLMGGPPPVNLNINNSDVTKLISLLAYAPPDDSLNALDVARRNQ